MINKIIMTSVVLMLPTVFLNTVFTSNGNLYKFTYWLLVLEVLVVGLGILWNIWGMKQ